MEVSFLFLSNSVSRSRLAFSPSVVRKSVHREIMLAAQMLDEHRKAIRLLVQECVEVGLVRNLSEGLFAEPLETPELFLGAGQVVSCKLGRVRHVVSINASARVAACGRACRAAP